MPLLIGLVFLGISGVTPSATWAAKRAKSAVRAAAAAAPSALDAHLGKVVGSIDVQGLKRIGKDAVLAKLISQPGKPLSATELSSDIQAVFGLGYFDDIDILGEDRGSRVDLTVVVKERPAIAKLVFDGNERVSTSDLQEVVKVKEWSILDVNKVKEDAALIQKHYEEKGFYLAKVSFDVQRVEGKADEVQLTYRINDYEKVQIKKITFLNNKRFGDEQLKGILQETREGSLFSFLSGSGNFKDSAFKNDLQRLTYWYLDHGYVKFRYEQPVVTISEDKRWLYITLYVDEGETYEMGEVDFGGDLLFTKDELHADLTLLSEETFSISRRNADIQKLTERYQDMGYAFVNVIPKMDVKDDSRTVDIRYEFEKGNLVYFREVNVLGNSKTHDKVIRRELKIREGELFSGTRLRESRENVERLGYFAPGEVVFNTVTPKGSDDQVDVEITVKERSTGTITLGAGYGTVQGFFFTTQVAEINLFGRGQTISLSAQLAADRFSKSFNLGFTDPYAFDSKWSLGFDLYYVTFPIPNKYNTRKLGFDLRAGYPIYEYTTAYVTYKNEGLRAEDPRFDQGIDPLDVAADQGVLSSVVWSLVRDKRNNRFETTDGNYQSASLETAGLGGDKKFVKWVVNNRYYKRLIGDLVFRTSAEYGQMVTLAGRRLPPSERFFLGGPNNLKGFEIFSIGPKRLRSFVDSTGSTITIDEPTGGTVEVFSLFELEYPLIRDAGIKVVAFYDVGNAFSEFPTADNFTLRSDAGFGLRWFSPIGPLRFEWGFPFKARPGEGTVFQFFIGPPF